MLKTINEICREHPALFTSEQVGYRLIREKILPDGVAVHVGRRLLINEVKLRAWIEAGGQALPGGWRREAQ